MKRRDFLSRTCLMAAGAAFSGSLIGSARRLAADEPPIYDPDYFEAAERFAFLSPQEAVISLLLKPGRALEIKLYKAQSPEFLTSGTAFTFRGVRDVLDIPLAGFFWGPEFCYKLEYREDSGASFWRSTPVRRVKTPNGARQRGRLEVIIFGDDHTFDDADMENRVVKDPGWRSGRLSGEYVNDYLRLLRRNPSYRPEAGTDESKTMSGYCLASLIRQVETREDPDLLLILGDSTGIGAGYKWPGLGLKDPAEATAADHDLYSRLFWMRMRRMYSALSPSLPVYLVLGNHDGESGYDYYTRPWALRHRKALFRQPGAAQGQALAENYFCLPWGPGSTRGDPLFIILDNESYNASPPLRPEDWTLGAEQNAWLRSVLEYETDWKFTFFHHVLGGWPRGTNEGITDYAYGRGPLFTAADYAPFCPDPGRVEQVALTGLMRQSGVRASFYGHDHIFFAKRVETGLWGICPGSPKPVGELAWYKGDLWNQFYGCRGHYQTEETAACSRPGFWSPSGYTKLTLEGSSARVEYKRASYNHPYTNVPPSRNPGDVLQTIAL